MFSTVIKYGSLEFVEGTLSPPSGGAVNCMFVVPPSQESIGLIAPRALRFKNRPGNLYNSMIQGALEEVRKSGNRLFGPFTFESNGRTLNGIHYLNPYLPGEDGAAEELTLACLLAIALGIPLVGLGGLLSAGGRGIRLANRYKGKLGIIAGGSGTAYALVLGLLEAAMKLRIRLYNSTLVIVGLGEVSTKTLFLLLQYEKHRDRFKFPVGSIPAILRPRRARMFKKIILVNSTLSKGVNEIMHRLEFEFCVPRNRIELVITERDTFKLNAALANGDINLLATSGETAEKVGIDPAAIKEGALVIDAGRPHNLLKIEKPHYLVIDGAILKTRNQIHDQSYKFIGTGDSSNGLGCFSELLDCAWRGITTSPEFDRHLSILTLENTALSMIENGFQLAPFRAFDQPLGFWEFARIKRLRRQVVVQNFFSRFTNVGTLATNST